MAAYDSKCKFYTIPKIRINATDGANCFNKTRHTGYGESTFRLHDEVDGAALLVAAEAVEEALLVVDREGRCLLVVEGAEACVLGTRAALQRHLPADDVGQAEARAQFVEEAGRERHPLRWPPHRRHAIGDSGDRYRPPAGV